MSIGNLLKSLTVVAVGGLAGYFSVQLLKPAPVNRFIASETMSKLGSEQAARSFLDVQVSSELAAKDSQISTLNIKIQALRDIPAGLNFSWNLPPELEVVEGDSSASLGALNAGESRQLSLRVKNFSKELKRFVSFEVQGQLNQRPVRREVLISSRIEDSFEYMLQQNELAKERKGKILGLKKEKSRFDVENVVR